MSEKQLPTPAELYGAHREEAIRRGEAVVKAAARGPILPAPGEAPEVGTHPNPAVQAAIQRNPYAELTPVFSRYNQGE